jgi:predicted Holliday junction resolvase-like endonuclease
MINQLFSNLGISLVLGVFVVGAFVGFVAAAILMTEKFEKKEKDVKMAQRNKLKGSISENMAPFLPDFPPDLKASEARFLGSPVDLIVFKGLDDKNVSEVVFVEVKTGQARLNPNEKSLKQAIDEKRVRYVQHRVLAMPELNVNVTAQV